ncbi:MAG: PAQR family membrane homeostasis protein TrhA [Trebonia sp.]
MAALDGVAEEPAPGIAEPPPAGTAGVPAVKPLLRGWLHLISFEASLVLGTLALAHAHGVVRVTALAVFAASVSAMFGASALYHRGNWAAAWHRRLQRLDHAMIFLLIAGTATPAFLIAAHGTARVAGLIAIWTLTLTAGAIHMAWMNAPELLVGGTFVALGWAAGLALPAVWLHSGAVAGALMLAGGLLYTAGALSYYRRWPNPSPAVFGYHEVFHVYVCAAAACQYTAIALFIT